MMHRITGNYAASSITYTLCLLSMIGAAKSISITNSIPQKYKIAGDYTTKSEDVRIASLVDLDQMEIERLLSLDLESEDSNWLEKARGIYENGMYAGPYALLKLTKPLDRPVDLPEISGSAYANSIAYDVSTHPIYEMSVSGINNNERYETTIDGLIRIEDPKLNFEAKQLIVFYPEGSTCMVNGRTDDCFAGPNGEALLQGYGAIEYSYDPETENYFQYSLKGFSEDESKRMYYCEHHGGCDSYLEYENFFKYYGILDYGNHWIDSAFSNKSTDFSRGNINFSVLSKRARNAAISTATVTMNTFTKINQLMVEYAIDGCKKSVKDFSTYGDSSSTDAVIAHWDQAVGIYAGSALIVRESDDAAEQDSKTGALYFHLVQELAENFGVLEESGKQSVLNKKILEEFKRGRFGLTQDDCDGQVFKSYWTIVHAMRVPWIQGVLKAAFVLSTEKDAMAISNENFLEEQRGRGAASLAALLPDLHSTSPTTAQVVHDEFEKSLSGGRLNYVVVRDALEHAYQFLSVTCDEVGGYLNPETGNYYQATRPCGGYGSMISQRPENVAYTSTASTQSSFLASYTISSLASSSFFIVALVVFFASLTALVSVGRYNHICASDGYHWLRKNKDDDFDRSYQVQLRTMPLSSHSHFQDGSDSVSSNSIGSIDESYVL